MRLFFIPGRHFHTVDLLTVDTIALERRKYHNIVVDAAEPYSGQEARHCIHLSSSALARDSPFSVPEEESAEIECNTSFHAMLPLTWTL